MRSPTLQPAPIQHGVDGWILVEYEYREYSREGTITSTGTLVYRHITGQRHEVVRVEGRRPDHV